MSRQKVWCYSKWWKWSLYQQWELSILKTLQKQQVELIKDWNFAGIDVEKGNIIIGSKGMDGSKANYVELIAN